jgi:curved DNA-binding protein
MSADTYPQGYAYKVLNVDPSDDTGTIKKAYRKLAAKYHPDRNPGNEEAERKFKEIGKAWKVLETEENRAKYDQGILDFDGNASSTASVQTKPMKNMADVFGEFNFDEDSSGSSQQTRSRETLREKREKRKQAKVARSSTANQNADLHCKISIGFKEAALGTAKNIKLSNGNVIKIKIPEGLEDNAKLCVSGKGKSVGGKTGDLYVEVNVKDHPSFYREGNDIYLDQDISLEDAVLGNAVDVETLRGIKTIKVDKSSDLKQAFCLTGEGIKGGNQYVNLNITLPEEIDPELKSWAQKKKDGLSPS